MPPRREIEGGGALILRGFLVYFFLRLYAAGRKTANSEVRVDACARRHQGPAAGALSAFVAAGPVSEWVRVRYHSGWVRKAWVLLSP